MHQAALLATFATDWLGAQNVRRFLVRFRDQVWPGDVLTCNGTVLGFDEVHGERRVQVELTCTSQSGAVVIAGEADFAVPA